MQGSLYSFFIKNYSDIKSGKLLQALNYSQSGLGTGKNGSTSDKRTLGNGRASNESIIKHYMIGTMSDDGELAIAGSSLDFEYFSKDLTAVNRFLIVKDQQKEYAPSEFLAYTTPEDCIARFHKGKLYEGLITDDADFMFGPDYEKEVCHIGVVNMTEGKALKSEIQEAPSMFSDDRAKYRALDFVMFPASITSAPSRKIETPVGGKDGG